MRNPFKPQARKIPGSPVTSNVLTSLVTSPEGRQELVDLALKREKLGPALTAIEIFCRTLKRSPDFEHLKGRINTEEELEWIQNYKNELKIFELPLETAATCHIMNDRMRQVEKCINQGWDKVTEISSIVQVCPSSRRMASQSLANEGREQASYSVGHERTAHGNEVPFEVAVAGIRTLHMYCTRHVLTRNENAVKNPDGTAASNVVLQKLTDPKLVRALEVADVFSALLCKVPQFREIPGRDLNDIMRGAIEGHRTRPQVWKLLQNNQDQNTQALRDETLEYVYNQLTKCIRFLDLTKNVKSRNPNNNLQSLVFGFPEAGTILSEPKHEKLMEVLGGVKMADVDTACGSIDVLLIWIEAVTMTYKELKENHWSSLEI